MEPHPTIELSSPSANPIYDRIASLEALRQEHLRAAAEIEREVVRLHELLVDNHDVEPVSTEHKHNNPTLTFKSEVEYHDDIIPVVKTDSPLEQASAESKSTLSVLVVPAPLLSPLPKANTMHAGHTPLVPGSPSPEHQSPTAETTPELYLDGPLTLPLAPGDGSDDGISLRALGERLADIAKEQAEDTLEAEVVVKSETVEVEVDRKAVEADGILLKKPPMNFGIPLGQL